MNLPVGIILSIIKCGSSIMWPTPIRGHSNAMTIKTQLFREEILILKMWLFSSVVHLVGYEKQLFKRTNEKQATQREAYLWSVADM